ncbi:putative holin [Pseudomonas phage PaMx33]|uniref:Putative holin n=1 Tax=Pseudomonas phage PaMx41 TaxID=1815976 RepID=A0A1C8HUC6_BPPP4|nr:holin [Pseudomonas phage PaMx41]ANA48868.1 putative holin [Pseudomonas phage PaMx33]ANA49033.1 putative holin [Pseudomonas phage PaMx43]ANA49087.1 putative holin [Pseudomonas phage PaMx46]QBP37257.1 putative holin [Pseudomonas phage vB_PaeP_TF17]ANA48978.1 putative holin [Pseudomonas phage PaMx41]
MNYIVWLYAVIILLGICIFLYTLWGYAECESTRGHRAYVLPIFTSIGWVMVGFDGVTAQIRETHGRPDGIAFLLLTASTLISLALFIQHYRRCHCETQRKTSTVHPAACPVNSLGRNSGSSVSSLGSSEKDTG